MTTPAAANIGRTRVLKPEARQSAAGPAACPSMRRDFFVYGINFSALANGAATSGAIQIQSDSDFELQKLSMFTDIAGAVQTEDSRVLPLVTLQITDTGTGRQMFNTPIAIPSIMGDGRIPFILPVTKIFSANASVSFTLANYSAGTTYNLRLDMIGCKLFKY